jgi:energy-coupling factor transporter ATP-binding protein EcfA2
VLLKALEFLLSATSLLSLAQIAEKTKDLANATMAQLQHQGNTLVVIDHDLHEVRCPHQHTSIVKTIHTISF